MDVNLPSFLCIGAQKAGTTWLHRNLEKNPCLWMADFKECQFFNSVHEPRHRSWSGGHVRKICVRHIRREIASGKANFRSIERYAKLGQAGFMFTDEWYRLIFTHPAAQGKITGDITPEYSAMPKSGIEHALRMLGPVPVIYLIRDPVARGLSHVKMRVSRKKLAIPQVDWIAEVNDWNTLNRGDYKSAIPLWESVWPREKILYIPFGRIRSEPERVMADVENFLGIDTVAYSGLEDEVFKGPEIEIPPEAVDAMHRVMAGQAEFLGERFGEEFLKQIK